MNEKQIEEIMQVRDEEFLMGIEGLDFDSLELSDEEQDEIEELDFDNAA